MADGKESTKKPFYKNWKFWVGFFAVMVVIGLFTPDEEKASEPEAEAVTPEKSPEEIADEKAENERKEEEAAAKIKAEEEAQAEKEKKKAEKDAKDKEEKDQRDVDNKEAVQSIIELSDGVIISIEPNPFSDDWEVVQVTVSDAWYNTPEHEKERFAETMGATIKASVFSEVTHVHFFDSYGKELATEKIFGGYKIKR